MSLCTTTPAPMVAPTTPGPTPAPLNTGTDESTDPCFDTDTYTTTNTTTDSTTNTKSNNASDIRTRRHNYNRWPDPVEVDWLAAVLPLSWSSCRRMEALLELRRNWFVTSTQVSVSKSNKKRRMTCAQIVKHEICNHKTEKRIRGKKLKGKDLCPISCAVDECA